MINEMLVSIPVKKGLFSLPSRSFCFVLTILGKYQNLVLAKFDFLLFWMNLLEHFRVRGGEEALTMAGINKEASSFSNVIALKEEDSMEKEAS